MTNEGSMTSIWVVRVLLLAVSATLAVVLVLRGNVVIGALIGVLVIGRAFVFVKMRRRREEFRRRLAERRGTRGFGQ
jgi:hypothetical protein